MDTHASAWSHMKRRRRHWAKNSAVS